MNAPALHVYAGPDYLRAFACGLILCDTVGCPATVRWEDWKPKRWQFDFNGLRRCPDCAANGVWGVHYAPRFPVPLPLPAPEPGPEPDTHMGRARKRTGTKASRSPAVRAAARKAIAPPAETEQPT
jgi:hypothetical protein